MADIKGMKELTAKLTSLKGLGKVFPMGAAQVIARRAQQLAPVDTGYLRDHIKAIKLGDGGAAVVSEADYSAHVEFGTYKMAAQPFLRVAIDEGEGDVLDAVKKALLVEIRRLI
jgi:HK97 gp10 family phage protein